MLAWYVAKTKPRQEPQTAVVLGLRGLETYFPLIAGQRRRRAGAELEPLFPGYLFVRLDATTPDWVVARSAPGVSYFLGIDRLDSPREHLPSPVPDELVGEIRRRVESGEYAPRRPTYRRGDRVAIVGGPFDGVEAIFDGTLSPAGRSRVLVDIVSRLVPVSVHLDQLRRIG